MRHFFAFLAPLGSAGLLAGALAFQYLGGLSPCAMCIWQRWPHLAAVVFGVIFFATKKPVVLLFGALSALVTALIGIYHAGVEKGIFEGPNTCTSNPIGSQSTEDLLNSIMNAPVVRCDEVAWAYMGISMAGWNAIISLVLMFLWIRAYRAN